MRFKFASSLVAAASLLPVLAQAEGFSYSYLEGAYINTDLDGIDEEIDGFALRGSFEVTDQVFLFAGYSDQSTSIFGTDVGLLSYDLGAGYAWSIAPKADLYGTLAYVRAEADVPGPNFDDDGYRLGVGLRGRLAESFEVEGALNYTDLSDTGDDTTFGLAGRYFITPQFAVGLEGEFGNDADTYGVSVRWDFGQ